MLITDAILKPVLGIDKRHSQSVQAWLMHTAGVANLLSSLDYTVRRINVYIPFVIYKSMKFIFQNFTIEL